MQLDNDSLQIGSIVVPWALDPLKDDLDLELHGCGCGGDCDSCDCSGECYCGECTCDDGDGAGDDDPVTADTAPDLDIDVPTLDELINAPMEPEQPQSPADEMVENIKEKVENIREALSVEIGEFDCGPGGSRETGVGIECTNDDGESISIGVRPDLGDGEVQVNVGYKKEF